MQHKDDPAPIIGIGKLNGNIIKHPKGSNGFGYDPIFYIPVYNKTLAELALIEKNLISHRALAVKSLKGI